MFALVIFIIIVIIVIIFIIVIADRHSSIFLTDEEMTGEEDLDDDMPELPEVTNIIFIIIMASSLSR